MSRQVWSIVGAAAVVMGLLASVGPAAQAIQNAFVFLWPTGIVGLLATLCLLLLLDRSRASRGNPPVAAAEHEPSVEKVALPVESGNRREMREAAYSAILSTSEAYINAHVGVDALAYPGVYTPELEEAEAVCDAANQAFVSARQKVEQHGVRPVLNAVLAVEDAVNKRAYDEAAERRRNQLVPAIRADMDRPTAAFF